MKPIRLILLVAAIAAASPAAATPPEAITVIRHVIADQIAAFQNDDAERAFGHAAPGIRQRFGSAAVFMQMVRRVYRPLYRPRAYAFEPLNDDGDAPIQPVRILDALGRVSLALYEMERQADGTWKIAGCILVDLPEEET